MQSMVRLSALLVFSILVGVQSQCSGEQNGTIVIQADSVAVTGNWVAETDVRGFTGKSYYTYVGDVRYNQPPDSILLYRVFSPVSRIYTLRLWTQRDRLGADLRDDEGNDLWLKLPGDDEWLKIFTPFGVRDRRWLWADKFDIHDEKIEATVNLVAGQNLIAVGGRSPRYSWDKLVLTTPTGVDINLATEYKVNCTTGAALVSVSVESQGPDASDGPDDPTSPVSKQTSIEKCIDLSNSAVQALLLGAFSQSSCRVDILVLFGRQHCWRQKCAALSSTRCEKQLKAIMERQFPKKCTAPTAIVSSSPSIATESSSQILGTPSHIPVPTAEFSSQVWGIESDDPDIPAVESPSMFPVASDESHSPVPLTPTVSPARETESTEQASVWEYANRTPTGEPDIPAVESPSTVPVAETPTSGLVMATESTEQASVWEYDNQTSMIESNVPAVESPSMVPVASDESESHVPLMPTMSPVTATESTEQASVWDSGNQTSMIESNVPAVESPSMVPVVNYESASPALMTSIIIPAIEQASGWESSSAGTESPSSVPMMANESSNPDATIATIESITVIGPSNSPSPTLFGPIESNIPTAPTVPSAQAVVILSTSPKESTESTSPEASTGSTSPMPMEYDSSSNTPGAEESSAGASVTAPFSLASWARWLQSWRSPKL